MTRPAHGDAALGPAQAAWNPLLSAGQHPFFWQPPDGYPDTLAYWVGLLLPRWNFGASLMNARPAMLGDSGP